MELIIAVGILGICLVIHIAGMVVLGDQLVRRRERIAARIGTVHTPLVLIVVFSIVVLLHVSEACVWAVFYKWGGLFTDFETSLYFSMTTYSTVGYGDVLLPEHWRLLGTIEAISGVLMCGLSAAFLFAIVNSLFRSRLRKELRHHFQRGSERDV